MRFTDNRTPTLYFFDVEESKPAPEAKKYVRNTTKMVVGGIFIGLFLHLLIFAYINKRSACSAYDNGRYNEVKSLGFTVNPHTATFYQSITALFKQ